MDIHEDIRVGVVFTERNEPRPRWFLWQKRKYNITEITYTWRARDGENQYVYFSVTDGANAYELSFNQKSLQWKLRAVSQTVRRSE